MWKFHLYYFATKVTRFWLIISVPKVPLKKEERRFMVPLQFGVPDTGAFVFPGAPPLESLLNGRLTVLHGNRIRSETLCWPLCPRTLGWWLVMLSDALLGFDWSQLKKTLLKRIMWRGRTRAIECTWVLKLKCSSLFYFVLSFSPIFPSFLLLSLHPVIPHSAASLSPHPQTLHPLDPPCIHPSPLKLFFPTNSSLPFISSSFHRIVLPPHVPSTRPLL